MINYPFNLQNGKDENQFLFNQTKENTIFNSINSDENNFPKNEIEDNFLKYNTNFNLIKNTDANLINCSNAKSDSYDIVNLLKNNPDINSYIHILDYLSSDDLLKMFSFILKNIMIFLANNQSHLIINKVISLYRVSLPIANSIKKDTNSNNINENIFAFLSAFFSKRIIYLINSNNYITIIINLVQTIGYPKNDFVFSEIIQDFKNYSNNRQGCILIQNIFPLGNNVQQQNLLGEIIDKINDLIIDRYGHYIYKYLLYKAENGEKYYTLILDKIVNNLKKYTSNKYSSVVIERLLDSSNENLKKKIIDKICRNENDVVELIYHAYGNYVLQKIISVTKDNHILGMIYKTIMKNRNSLYKLSYGKKIMKEISVAYTLK